MSQQGPSTAGSPDESGHPTNHPCPGHAAGSRGARRAPADGAGVGGPLDLPQRHAAHAAEADAPNCHVTATSVPHDHGTSAAQPDGHHGAGTREPHGTVRPAAPPTGPHHRAPGPVRGRDRTTRRTAGAAPVAICAHVSGTAGEACVQDSRKPGGLRRPGLRWSGWPVAAACSWVGASRRQASDAGSCSVEPCSVLRLRRGPTSGCRRGRCPLCRCPRLCVRSR